MDRAELAFWLRLTLTPGVGNATARKLLAAFGLPHDIFRQSASALAQVVGLDQATALGNPPPDLEQQLAATWNWLHEPPAVDQEQPCRMFVTLGDPAYPGALLATDDPPLVLYFQGHPGITRGSAAGPAPGELLAHGLANCVAIVGSRNPTPQGAANAHRFAKAMAQAGLTVVSGLAMGIDGAAHEGALEGVGPASDRLATIAVVGTGLDRVYPKRHRDLAHRIVRRGLLMSEYPIGTPPLAANFPRRNRIIAALSRGTLVVEAALQSGSLITARLAAEQGKDVFAIPGSIHSTQARGCHALIKQGAKLVESVQDVLEEMHWSTPAPPVDTAGATHNSLADGTASDRDDALLRALGFDPVSLDALLARTGFDAPQLLARLMALELEGRVARLPGGLFQRQERA